MEDELLTTAEVARLTGYCEQTLRRLRCNAGGPPFFQRVRGGLVRYRRGDVLGWLEDQRRWSIRPISIVSVSLKCNPNQQEEPK